VNLNRDVAVQAGSRVITLAGGHRMTFLGREGRDAARIRYAGADYIVPFSAIRPRTIGTSHPFDPIPVLNARASC
jgi:hypothetical protein